MFTILWSEFPKYNCLQLNDSHPALALVELFRILLDEKGLGWEAFNILQRTFNYNNHKVLPGAIPPFI